MKKAYPGRRNPKDKTDRSDAARLFIILRAENPDALASGMNAASSV